MWLMLVDYVLSKASLLFQSMFLFQVYSKVDDNPLRSILSLPMHVSYSVLFRNWWKAFLKHPSFSKVCCLSSSYSELMKILSEASLLLQCVSHMFLFKIDEIPLWSIPSFPKHFSNPIHIQRWWKSFLKHPSSTNACFSFSSYSRLMNILSEAPSSSKALFSFSCYWRLLKFLSEVSLLFQSMFLIQLLR